MEKVYKMDKKDKKDKKGKKGKKSEKSKKGNEKKIISTIVVPTDDRDDVILKLRREIAEKDELIIKQAAKIVGIESENQPIDEIGPWMVHEIQGRTAVVFIGVITSKSIKTLISVVQGILINLPLDGVVTIFMCSGGGSLDAAYEWKDGYVGKARLEKNIQIKVFGECSSAAQTVLCSAHYRVADKDTKMIFHRVAGGSMITAMELYMRDNIDLAECNLIASRSTIDSRELFELIKDGKDHQMIANDLYSTGLFEKW